MRSYENFALGLAVLPLAVAVARTAWIPRPIGYLIPLGKQMKFPRAMQRALSMH